jgi:hypothetical protein
MIALPIIAPGALVAIGRACGSGRGIPRIAATAIPGCVRRAGEAPWN